MMKVRVNFCSVLLLMLYSTLRKTIGKSYSLVALIGGKNLTLLAVICKSNKKLQIILF